MASTTKNRIAEQIVIYVNGGRSPDATKLHLYEARLGCEQVINKLLKVTYMSENFAIGEASPNGFPMATYDGIAVVPYGKTSKSVLPAYPVKLPYNIGVRVFPTGDFAGEYIPLQTGDFALTKSSPILSNLLGNNAFETHGMDVIYNKDLTNNGHDHPTVTVMLAVLDISQYGDNDILPMPSEMEWDVIKEVCAFYGVEPNPNKIADPGVAGANQTPPNQQMMA